MKIERRLMLAVGVTFLVFSAVMTVSLLFYSWISFSELKAFDRKTLYEQKTAELMSQVDFAYGIALHHYNNDSLKPEERRKIAVSELSALRYDGGSGFFYALERADGGFRYAFHGGNMPLTGQTVDTEAVDDDGKKYIREIIDSAGLRGTCVEYEDRNVSPGKNVRMIAYARNVSDWNWVIIGTISVADVEKAIKDHDRRLDSIISRSLAGSGIIVCVMLLFSIFIIKRMTSRIVRPIRRMSSVIGEIHCRKDLTRKIEATSNDEVGMISSGMNEMLEGIRLVIREIAEIAGELRKSSGGMMDASRGFAGSACEQASDAEEVTASVEEISAASDSIRRNAEKQAEELSFLSSEMTAIAAMLLDLGDKITSADAVARNMEGNSACGEAALEKIHSAISELEANSGQMNAIVSLIMDISDKINLLSLNAAIESARAGDAGRGFAVVADEISKLADETSGSIKNIESLIRENNGKIVLAAEHATGAGESFRGIRGDMTGMKDFFDGLSGAMNGYVSKNEVMGRKVKEIADRAAAVKAAMTEHVNAIAGITQATADISEKSSVIAENSRYLEDTALSLETCADRLRGKSSEFIV